jgi:hypothetical protein
MSELADAVHAGASSWTAETITVLIAAVLAAVASTAAAVIAAVAARQSRLQTGRIEAKADERYREYTGREQWWTRFSWAMEKAVSERKADAILGMAVISAMLDAPWATVEDNEMALYVARTVGGTAEQEGGATHD